MLRGWPVAGRFLFQGIPEFVNCWKMYNSKYKNELSELMQLAEWDLKNAKAKDPDGDYSVFDFMP